MPAMSELSDEQRGLRDSVRALLAKQSDSAAVRRAVDEPRGYDEKLWAVLCEQIGVAALAVPEHLGGAGAGPRESALVMEELGRTLTPAPMLGSAVLAAQLLLALDDAAANERLLPRIAGGTVAAVAWAGPRGAGTRARRASTRPPGSWPAPRTTCSTAITPRSCWSSPTARSYEVDPPRPGASTPRRWTSPGAWRGSRSTTHRPRASGPLTPPPHCAAARDHAVVALANEQVGAAARIFELTVQYTKDRHQFGRPIGSFQAIKHRMADLHVRLESARSAATPPPTARCRRPSAKAYCSEAFQAIAAEAIQLHGGIAITWEHDAHLYFKRAHGSAQLFGTPGEHVRRLGEELA